MKINFKTELSKYLTKIYMNEEEIPVFCYYASLAKGILVDIGAGWGASATLMLASTSHPALIYSIDPFTGDTAKPDKRVSEETCRENITRALESMDLAEALVRWFLIALPSHEVAASWNRTIDLVYIDGDHRYEQVRQDFEDWFRHLKVGGIILLHDSRRFPNEVPGKFARGWPGPTRLAKELRERKDLEFTQQVFSMTIWRKR